MNSQTPCIIIPGFCQSKLNIVDDKGNFVKKVWPAKFDTKRAAKKVLPAFFRTVITRKDSGFTDSVNDIFKKILEPASVLPSGKMKYNVETVRNEASLADLSESTRHFAHKIAPVDGLCEEIGDENIYLFSYNFFSSPFETARELDSFITFVKNDSGSDKVDLLPYSLGGTVALTYLDLFGNKNDTRRIFYLVTALDGSDLIADVLSKNVDKKQGYSILEFIFSKEVADTFRKVLFFTPWEVRYALLYKGLDTAIETVLKNSPFMWSLVPSERYEKLSAMLLSGSEYSELLKITDRYHKIQTRREKILSDAKNSGTDIFICAGYSQRFLKISLDNETSTDRILSLKSSSGISAKLGETPDIKCALFPETTFLIKNLSHVTAAQNDKVQYLVKNALTCENISLIENEEKFITD